MKASVIICTFNRAESLRTALQCLEWQTYDDFEVIVVNGPSTDETSKILERYDGKIIVFENLQKNYIISRNMGANAASGDVLCYIDDDSEPDTTWLANVMHEFEDPRVGAVTGKTYGKFASDQIYSAWVCNSKFTISKVDKIFPHFSSSESDVFPVTHGCNMSIRRVALEKVGGFLEDFVFYHDEPELCRRLVNAGYSIENVESCSLVHNTCSVNNDKKMRDKNRRLLRPYHALKNAIYLRYLWREKDELLEDVQIAGQAFAKTMFDEGAQRYALGIISYEEWCHYKDGVSRAVLWGIEHGEKLDLRGPQICAADATAFLPFAKRRRANALVICLFLWSLSDDSGGPGHAYSLLAKELACRGHEVHVMGRAEGEAFRQFADNVHWHHLDVQPNICVDNAPTTSVVLQNCSAFYDTVSRLSKTRVVDVCMGFIYTSAPLFLSCDVNFNSILTLCTTHETWCKAHPHWKSAESALLSKLESLVVSKHNNIHTISDFITHQVNADYPGSMHNDANIFNIPLGTQCSQSNFGKYEDAFVRILFLSRIEGRKCPDVLLAAFVKLAQRNKKVRLIMAGNDTLKAPTGRTYRDDFERQYFGTDVFKQVHFTGFISEEEKWEQYHSCDIFCMPSFSESFGIPFIEAMACGKPVVGCRAGGMPEVIVEGETGFLAEPRDVDSLVTCLEPLVCDKHLRESMGKAGRRRYEQNYTSEIYAQRMEKEFFRIAGKL